MKLQELKELLMNTVEVLQKIIVMLENVELPPQYEMNKTVDILKEFEEFYRRLRNGRE